MNINILSGFGGKARVTIPVPDTETEYSDEIDVSKVESLVVNLISTSEGGSVSVQVEQTFDRVNWASLGSPITSLSAPLKLDITDRPFGIIRLTATWDGSDSDSSDPASDSSDSTFSGANTTDIVVDVIGFGAVR